MASRVKKSHTDRQAQCGNVCPTEKRKSARKERCSQDHLSVALPLCAPLFPFLFFGRGSQFSPTPVTKMSSVCLQEKEVSVSATAWQPRFGYVGVLTTHHHQREWWDKSVEGVFLKKMFLRKIPFWTDKDIKIFNIIQKIYLFFQCPHLMFNFHVFDSKHNN